MPDLSDFVIDNSSQVDDLLAELAEIEQLSDELRDETYKYKRQLSTNKL